MGRANRTVIQYARRRERLRSGSRFLQQTSGGDLWWRLCRAGLHGAAGGRDVSLDQRPGMFDGLGLASPHPAR